VPVQRAELNIVFAGSVPTLPFRVFPSPHGDLPIEENPGGNDE
jgi:hypothetical protein